MTERFTIQLLPMIYALIVEVVDNDNHTILHSIRYGGDTGLSQREAVSKAQTLAAAANKITHTKGA